MIVRCQHKQIKILKNDTLYGDKYKMYILVSGKKTL